MREQCGGEARVFCRFTHIYPDGPAPYFTVLAPARRGAEVEQWAQIKRAVSEAIIAEGGTITHHHAVGRDHRPWYDRQRPEPFAAGAAWREGGGRPARDNESRRADRSAVMSIAVLGPGGVGGLIAGAARSGRHTGGRGGPGGDRGGDLAARPARGQCQLRRVRRPPARRRASGGAGGRADRRHEGLRTALGAGAQ